MECWADTIIHCPFCEGYENRDRIWGIVVNSKVELPRFTRTARDWTSKIKVFIPQNITLESSYRNELSRLDIPVYRGIITNVNHTNSKVESVKLHSGEKIEVDTLWWIPSKRPSQLIRRLVEKLGLEVDGQQGDIKTDQKKETNVKGLFAAGDIAGSMGALGAAHVGGKAATSILHKWYRH